MLSATKAAELIARRELSSEELVTACLDRIAKREHDIWAWAYIDAEAALAQARARDGEAPRGPLHGMPVGVKDMIDTADQLTRYGSPMYEGRMPARDAACVAWLREQGAVVLGKTITTEFATYEPAPTANPLDPSRTPGGSSSGSAAAVADGMVPLAYGTQTAGSTIRPASFCGVVGFKPSHGWRSTDGIKRLSERLDTLGVFGPTVADAAMLGDWPDPEPRESRIAVCPTPWWERLEDGGRAAIEDAAARLRAPELTLPAEFAGLPAAHETVMAFDVAHNLAPEASDPTAALSTALREYIEEGRAVDAEAVEAAVALADRCRAALPEVLADLDALLVPAVLGEAPVGRPTGDPLPCRAWTLLGTPAISIPGLTGPAGMPIGVQLVALPGAEERLLGAAMWAEAALRG